MQRLLNTFCAIALSVSVFVSPGIGEAEDPTKSTLNWLKTEPVTLMDLGMMRLREDVREASSQLITLGYTNQEPTVGTYYEWRRQQIKVYVSVREPFARPEENTCLAIYDRVIRHMKSKAPGGTKSMGWYLESIFVHEGSGNWGRPRQMQEGLLNAVRFEVTILPPDPMRDSRKVRCSGRMDSEMSDVSVTIS